jgi:four helix bundle protein
MLDHQKLDVYRLALSFVASTHQLSAVFPRGNADLLDQLKRAAVSVPLNIAEGNGKPTAAERRRILSIARGSALECSAALDVMLAAGLIGEEEVRPRQEMIERIVAMLSKMCR